MEIKSDQIPKEVPMENPSSTYIFEAMEKDGEEVEDLNTSYSDTSSDGVGLSSPPPRMIKIQKRRPFVIG